MLEDNCWSKLDSNGPVARSGHCAALIGEILYVFGGLTNTEVLQDFHSLDLRERKWNKIKSETKPPGRASSAMCGCDALQKLYLFGGTTNIVEKMCKNDLYCYEIESNEWSVLQPGNQAPSERYGHSMVLHNNILFLFGGVRFIKAQNRMNPEFLNDFWVYSLLLKFWTKIELRGQTPQQRYRHGCVFVRDDMYIIGGTTNQNRFGQIAKADFENMQWTYLELEAQKNKSKKNLFKGRFGHACMVMENMIYIYGGYDEGLCDDALQLDVLQNQWSRKRFRGEVVPRDFFGYAFNQNQLFIVGGKTQQEARLNDVYMWNHNLKQDEKIYCTLGQEMLQLIKSTDNCADVVINGKALHSKLLSIRCPKLNEIKCAENLFLYLLNYIYAGKIDYALLRKMPKREMLNVACLADDKDLLLSILIYLLQVSINQGDLDFVEEELQKLRIPQDAKVSQILKEALELLSIKRQIQTQQPVSQKAQQHQTQQSNQASKGVNLFQKQFKLTSYFKQRIQDKYYQDMKLLQGQDQSADVLIQSGGQEYRVHSFVLVARSEFFKEMVRFEEGTVQQIKLEQLNPKVLEVVLNYLYNGYKALQKDQTKDFDRLLELHKITNYLMLSNRQFVYLLEEGMAQYLNNKTIFEIARLAEQINASYLMNECCAFLAENLKGFSFEQLNECSKDFLIRVLQSIGEKQ